MSSYYIKLPFEAGGGGAVDSVNGQTGIVVLTATDVGADPAGTASTLFDLLGDKYVRTTRFQSIGSGTSGSVTLPPNSQVVLDDFGGTTDAVVATITGGRPNTVSAVDAGGTIIGTTFDSSGNYSFTGTPSAYPVGLIYRVQQKLSDFDSTATDIMGIPTVETASGGSSYTFNDTNSINLTDTANVITADLNLSSAAADTGYLLNDLSIETDGLRSQVQVATDNLGGVLVVGPQQLPGGDKNFFKTYIDSDNFNANFLAQTIINNTTSTDNAFNIAFYPQMVVIDDVDHNEVTVGGLLGVSNIGNGNINNILAGIAFTVEHEGTGTVAGMLGMTGAVNTTAGSVGNVGQAIGGILNVEHEGEGTISEANCNVSSVTNFDVGIITDANTFIADIANEGAGEIENGYVLKCARIQATNKFGVVIDVPESQNTLHQLTLKAALDIVPSDLVDDTVILVDAKLSNIFDITLTASNTLGNPTDAKDGQELVFRIRQDGTGGHSLTLDTKFRFGTTLPSISISTAPNSLNYLTVIYNQADDTFDVVDFKAGF